MPEWLTIKSVYRNIAFIIAAAIFLMVSGPIIGDVNDGRFYYRDGTRSLSGNMNAGGYGISGVSQITANAASLGSLAMTGDLNMGGNGLKADTAYTAQPVTRTATRVVCTLVSVPSGQCDKVTDGTADNVEIAAAVTEAAGGTVQLIGATFNLAVGLTINIADTTLRGESNTTLVLGAGVAGPVVNVTADRVKVESLKCNLNGQAQTCFQVNNADQVKLLDLYTYDSAAQTGSIGVYITGTSDEVWTTRLHTRFMDIGYRLDAAQHLGYYLTDSLFAKWTADAIYLGGNASGAPRRIFMSNVMVPGDSEVGVSGPFLRADYVGTLFISGMEAQSYGASSPAIALNMQTGDITWVQISDCEIIGVSSPAIKINASGGHTLGYLDITNCHIASTGEDSIEIVDGAYIAQTFTCTNCSFTENKTTPNAFDAIQVTAGNAPVKLVGASIFGQSSTVRYGINTPATNRIELMDSYMTAGDWGTAAWNNRPLVVRNVRNQPTATNGTATVLDNTTSIAVTHGLAITPAAGDCVVTPTTSLGAASEYYIDTYTSTQFTIHVDADPDASVGFAWSCDVTE